ncbi:MAG: restriction endonuclease subunit S [Prevotella sp.]|nr:restriction endonuclease subunit S [Prevotella sp.]
MEEWIRCNIGDVCKTISDTYRGNADEVVLVNTSDVLEGKCLNHQKSPNKDLKGQFKKTFLKDDILYSEIRPANKRFAYIDFDVTDYIASTKLMVIRHNENIIPQFLYYIITSQTVIEELQMLAESRSGTFPQITFSELASLPIALPPLSEQKKIVRLLKSLDDKIEVNRQINDNFLIESFFQILLIWMLTTLINDNLEQQAQALFKSWFVDFEPFRDQPFTKSELGMIPNGWRATVLDELCSFISRGLTPKYDESSDELILGQTCVRNNIVTLDNARRHKPKQRTEKWVQQWDTLINSTGVGSLGRVGIVYFNMDNIAIDSHITVARPKSALVRHYVGRNLLSRQLEIENMAIGSTGQTELPKDRVKSLLILLPDDNSLTLFNAIIEPIAFQLYRNIEESRRLASLRDTLLPRLMSGELKVCDVVL